MGGYCWTLGFPEFACGRVLSSGFLLDQLHIEKILGASGDAWLGLLLALTLPLVSLALVCLLPSPKRVCCC